MLFVIGLIGTAIAAAIAAGAIGYLSVQLTASLLKRYRLKKTSKVLAAQVGELIKTNAVPTMKLDELNEDDVLLAEYSEEEEALVQDVCIAKDVEGRVREVLESNNGIVVFD